MPTSEEMTLDAFEADLMRRFARFKEHWQTNAAQDPNGWPLRQGPAEWWEHFNLFLELGE